MRFTLGSLLLVLLLACSLFPIHGVLETNDTNLKCQCLRSTSNWVPIRLIEKIQIWPPGNGCPTREVIVWMTNKTAICLNPQSKLLQKLINLMWRKKTSTTLPAPVSKKSIA
ncbi:C-X-C motif chemokine 13 [Phacochoerus africanus]|uniref:C-X-C motif chemokine n=2 Tax=Sus scrofa TaxID=9823 RepID=A0A4X1SVT8_PIG|nr:C-X-C motif chemokine 13 [Sus scrofa]XP_047655363.1 C-X-C motif chemokine 13 [Phacochoerus africanus]